MPSVSRVVFDTNVVLSALLFPTGRLAWLRAHWRQSDCVPLVSRTTVTELARVFAYPKFHLSADARAELMGLYLPYCETVESTTASPVLCSDANDQPFLDLAHCGKADFLVTGDDDLLVLSGDTPFVIETPEAYRCRTASQESSL